MTEYRLASRTLRNSQRNVCSNPARGFFYGLILVAPFWTAALAIVWAVRS